ncbi:MAG: hypothetical protein ACRDMV_19590 [Streptosporangiales bacterium]
MPAAEHRLGSCEVAVTARLRGDQDRRVQGVAAVASRTGTAHIALRVGQVLVYLEDREALDALRHAVRKAEHLADEVFGPVDDAFARAEAHARREFEKGRRTRP